MGNQTSKQNAKINKIKQTVTSPLSPLRKQKRKQQTPKVQKFDWLSEYNQTSKNPNPQPLPTEFSFNEFQLHHERKLGEGAFAKVILATHIATGMKVAVKVTTKSQIPEEMQDYVAKEPGVLAQMNHKNIVKLLLVHEDKSYIYMFLQYMAGGDLHSRLERDGAIKEDVAKEWFKQIIAALEYSHNKKYCHRDLKLENLLISGEGKKAKVLMIDFGFAGLMPTSSHRFQDFPGSFCYAAPELIQGIPYKGRSADIYSMGVILYTMLQSTYPFYHDDRREMTDMILNDTVTFDTYNTAPARELVKWMLMKNPESRPSLEQIKNHPWMRTENMMSPLKKSANRIRNTARASLSPIQNRRKVPVY